MKRGGYRGRTRIEDEIFDPKYHYLGTLCKRNHIHENTGKSRRYISNNNCVLCHAANTRKYKPKVLRQKQEQKAEEQKKAHEAKIWATLNCKRYGKCLDKARDIKEEVPCYKCEEVILNEKRIALLGLQRRPKH